MKADRIYKFQIRQDLIDEDLNVPIIWIEPVFSCGKLLTNSRKETQMITAESGSLKEDYPAHGYHFLEHTPTLEVKESLPEGMDEMVTAEGYNTIISVTDPEHGWVDRKALAYSIDFQCYDESEPRMKTYRYRIHRTEEYSGTVEIQASSEEEAFTLVGKEILLIERGEKDLDNWSAGDDTIINEEAWVLGERHFTRFNWRD